MVGRSVAYRPLTRPAFRALPLVLLLAACEADITPVHLTESPFSLWGALTTEADTQRVRVSPIEPTIAGASDGASDARFRSTDRNTGDVVSWTEGRLREEDGRWVSYFWAAMRVPAGHTFLLEAVRSDGERTWVEVTIPPATELVLGEPSQTHPVTVPVQVRGGAPRLLNLSLEYQLDYRYMAPVPAETPPPDPLVQLSYDGTQVRAGEAWIIPINLTGDLARLVQAIQTRSGARINRLYGLRIQQLRLRFVVANEEWNPPGGSFDPEILVQPGTMSNVQNGFGFVGAGYHHDLKWLPPDEAVIRAGFIVPRDTTGG